MASGNILSGEYERTNYLNKPSKPSPYQVILKQGEPEYLEVFSENAQSPNRHEADNGGYLQPVGGTTHGESSNVIPFGEYLTTDGTNSGKIPNVHSSDYTDTGGYYSTVGGTTDSQATNQLPPGDRHLMPLPSPPGDTTEVYEEIPNAAHPKSKKKRLFLIVGVIIGVLVLIGIVVLLMYFLVPRDNAQEQLTTSQMTSSLTSETSASISPMVSTVTPQQSSPSETVCAMKADILFALDSSGSINDRDPGNWDRILYFVESFVMSSRLLVGPDEVRIAASVYSNDAFVELHFSETLKRNEVANRVRSLQYFGGNTNMAAALEKARTTVFTETNGDRSSADDIMILLSDGRPTRRVSDTQDQAEQLKRAGVYIITVGLTQYVDEILMSNISSSNQLLYVENFDQLSTILDPLIKETCNSVQS